MTDLHTRLVEAITARLNLAEAASPAPWTVAPANGDGDCRMDGPDITGYACVGYVAQNDAWHIAANDPAFVAGACRADLDITAEIRRWQHHTAFDCWYSCPQATETNGYTEDACCNNEAGGPCDCGLDRRRAAILGALATKYAVEVTE